MTFCYCHSISCVRQGFRWYFTLWAQYTWNSAVGELKYFRGQWHMKQVAVLPSGGHSLQFFGTWNPVKTTIIRIYEHLSEDTTSVGLQFMEGNIGSLELISSWRQENERSNCLELPISKVQVSRAVSALRLKLCIAWQPRRHGQHFQVSYSGSCSENWSKAWGLSFPWEKCCGDFMLHVCSSSAPVCWVYICLGYTNLWGGSVYSTSCSPSPEARLGKGSWTATNKFLEFLV